MPVGPALCCQVTHEAPTPQPRKASAPVERSFPGPRSKTAVDGNLGDPFLGNFSSHLHLKSGLMNPKLGGHCTLPLDTPWVQLAGDHLCSGVTSQQNTRLVSSHLGGCCFEQSLLCFRNTLRVLSTKNLQGQIFPTGSGPDTRSQGVQV